MGSQIAKLTTEVKDLLTHPKTLEADVAAVRNMNSKLVERIVATELQCWENSRGGIQGIPSIRVLEEGCAGGA